MPSSLEQRTEQEERAGACCGASCRPTLAAVAACYPSAEALREESFKCAVDARPRVSQIWQSPTIKIVPKEGRFPMVRLFNRQQLVARNMSIIGSRNAKHCDRYRRGEWGRCGGETCPWYVVWSVGRVCVLCRCKLF